MFGFVCHTLRVCQTLDKTRYFIFVLATTLYCSHGTRTPPLRRPLQGGCFVYATNVYDYEIPMWSTAKYIASGRRKSTRLDG